ncbi:MAG: ABC transporter permease [bacterium]|nr:ABC transporter permease [bacterium]
MRWIARRLLHGLLLLLGVSVLTFAFTEIAPGDYFDEMRLDPRISAETVEALRSRYGLDRPLHERYLRWLGSVLRGEFGHSFAYHTSVGSLLWVRARNTLLLTGLATGLAWLIAVPLGAWAAASKRRWVRALFGGGTSLLLAIPDILLALLFLLLAVRTGWFPVGGMASLDYPSFDAWGKVKDLVHHFALPVTAMTLATLPVLVRHVHASMSEVLRSPFLLSARGFGIPPRRLLFRYALPVAANPLISLFGHSVGSLLSASLLIEVVLSWPGIGPLLLESILARDVHVVIGAVLMSTVLLIVGNLLADVLLYAADPRIRVES